MSLLNINRNIFLEREELLRWQQFLIDSPAANVFLGNTSQYGVIKTDFVTDLDFKVEVGTNVGTFKIGIISKALTKSKLLICQETIDNVSVTQDSNWYWIKIAHKYRVFEEGKVSVDINGNLVGLSTKFTDVLRQQSTSVPTKIKFYKESGVLLNIGSYEVLGITDNLSCVLQGDFVAESDLRYIVLGSLAIGETVTSQIEEGLYKYDSCELSLVAEEVTDTPPTTDFVTDEEFYLARVQNNSGILTIEDKRQFWNFNIKGVADKLSKNPSEWAFTNEQQATALDKLGTYSKAKIEQLAGVDSYGWVAMTRGSGADATGFSVKIKRVGKTCICQGTFVGASGIDNGDVIASITVALFGGTLSEEIFFPVQSKITDSANDGVNLKLIAEDDALKIVVYNNDDADGLTFKFNFSFFID